ncbi:hypothetical protein ACLOJK_011279 [Asimina triloba]
MLCDISHGLGEGLTEEKQVKGSKCGGLNPKNSKTAEESKKMRIAVVGAGVGGLAAAHILAKGGVEVVLYEKEDHLGGHARTVTSDDVDVDLGFMVFNPVTGSKCGGLNTKNSKTAEESKRMRIAVVGAGVGGLAAAHILAKGGVEVVLYEKEDYLGGHARTVTFDGVDVDLGFMVFNRVTYPNMMEWFESMGIEMESADMSFSVSLDKGKGCEWGSRNGLSGLFAQKTNAFSPSFWQMLREMLKFKTDVLQYLEEQEHNPDIDRNETLGSFIQKNGYSKLFQEAYLLFRRPQWLTVKSRSRTYVHKVKEELENRCCQIRTGCEVQSVSTIDGGCCVLDVNGSQETFDGCILAVHSPDALKILGEQATYEERRVLGSFQYVYSDIFLHRDKAFMQQNSSAWSAWNFLGTTDNKVCLTYWLNVLQNLGDTGLPFLVTLNPPHTPQNNLLKWTTSHPFPSVAASKAMHELDGIQGKRRLWFCYGFHEDGLKAGLAAAHGVLGKNCILLRNMKHMVPSLMETGARLVTRFLERFICVGSLILLEEGGTIFEFAGSKKKSCLKSVIKVHHPSFYWKVATQADLGLADAYINGDFSCVDKEYGLLNMFMSNDLFALFLDETMTYSCAVFKNEHEDLKVAQLRKISLLIEKARINCKHEILEIGCGWGSLAIEVVKRTGCKYTGITLSEEQLKYAQQRVNEAGLEDRIKFLLCDYRRLPSSQKFDRIISCGMLETVGHEYMEEFFRCCESVLAEDGLLVLLTRTLGDYQIVFSRPGNLSAFNDPYEGVPSTY